MQGWQRQSNGCVVMSPSSPAPALALLTLLLPVLARQVTALSLKLSSSERHASQLTELRILERKMGLVLTLFKASVWSLIQTHQDEMEEEEQRQREEEAGGHSTEYRSQTNEPDGTVTHQDYAY